MMTIISPSPPLPVYPANNGSRISSSGGRGAKFFSASILGLKSWSCHYAEVSLRPNARYGLDQTLLFTPGGAQCDRTQNTSLNFELYK